MKKLVCALSFLLFAACSDGDLQIETIDFDSVAVDNCGDLNDEITTLFKINGDEALILTLQSGVLQKGIVGDTVVTTVSTIPGQSKLVYRIFSENVSKNYFCDEIPPVSPVVTEEIDAEDGMVIIETTVNADSTAFDHAIKLSEITLVNDAGERITDLTINDFGEISTPIDN
ncbi:MAG: hypothetical protein CMH48_10855 [Muricauda sp.]|uniref:Lipoprotein n=1 Tax=Flagellimonas lutaonensis TaxID=516051 RepID=A0A0D5YPB7_9FLAO|nr:MULTISPECIES: hypothetical protein [Allomuricauda]AKA34057.1 hypothetical protein VC82_375 [Allomuricauda lutaonensis]MBC31332.1 hypothetical protein [Allomuricauda sp.]